MRDGSGGWRYRRMNLTSCTTPLHPWHVAYGGRMVDFAGWSMPVQYTSIVAEHQATRKAASFFDISHMGRLRFSGAGAAEWLSRIVTRDVTRLEPQHVVYALVTNKSGGILDDVLVYHLLDAVEQSYFLLVVNAGNRLKIVDWINEQAPGTDNVPWSDVTTQWAMIAVQGPLAWELVQPLVETDLASLKYYRAHETRIAGHGGIVSRTGYTGEDGFELIVGSAAVVGVWETLVNVGASVGAIPAGLGARDTLRLEAAMPLYGHELTEEINPFQAGLSFAVDLDRADFIGRQALVSLRKDRSRPVRAGFEVEGKRVPREGATVLAAGQAMGTVTSGTFSPTLERSIAMGYVPREYSKVGTPLEIDIRGKSAAARVVKLPFYRRPVAKEARS